VAAQGGLGPLSQDRPEWTACGSLTEEEKRVIAIRESWQRYWDSIRAIAARASVSRAAQEGHQ
jgi:hypothetical protein